MSLSDSSSPPFIAPLHRPSPAGQEAERSGRSLRLALSPRPALSALQSPLSTLITYIKMSKKKTAIWKERERGRACVFALRSQTQRRLLGCRAATHRGGTSVFCPAAANDGSDAAKATECAFSVDWVAADQTQVRRSRSWWVERWTLIDGVNENAASLHLFSIIKVPNCSESKHKQH